MLGRTVGVTEILEKHLIITGMLGKTRHRRQENN
jgi:hypothetical protein